MDREIKPVWSTVGKIDPRDLVEARTQLHWAAQPVMAFADCALEHVSDDSQANLGWSDDLEAPARISHHVATAAHDMPQSAASSRLGVLDALSSTTPRPLGRKRNISRHLTGLATQRGEKGGLVCRQRPDGLSAGLRIPDMTLMVFDEGGATADSISLEGQTIDSAVSWLEEVVAARSGGATERPIRIRDYEMPAHPVAEGAAFVLDYSPAFAELARWFANGNLVLRELASSDRGWAEVRCWPHHFDLGTVISLESSGDASSGQSIGVGLSPGDTSYSEPYLYVNPYGLTDQPANQPPLESGAHWYTDGWFGAVLTATAIVVNPGGTQESEVLSFLHGAVDAARNLLTE